ncbi:hypothetical protein D3C76_816070 [compost metagenome]
MNDDGPVKGVIVEAGLQAFHAQRVTVLAEVALLGAEQTDAGGVAFVAVGEQRGHVFTAVAAMGDQFVKQQLAPFKVEDPQALFGRGQGVIDHRQSLGGGDTLGTAALSGTNGQGNHFGVGAGCCFDQRVFKRIGVG